MSLILLYLTLAPDNVPGVYLLLQVFRKLFEEGLKTQRDRIRDLRQYSRDQREERARKQKDELTSIENLYPSMQEC